MLPVAVISGKRPKYLRECLLALRANSVDPSLVYLFQEGEINKYSERRFAPPDVIEACISTFKEIFPEGHLITYPYHVGVAFTHLYAKNHLFDVRGWREAIFLEDDFVPAPSCISVIREMLRQAPPWAGFLSPGVDTQGTPGKENLARTKPFHNWCFGLRSYTWKAMRPFIDEYLLLVECDYKLRPHKRIRDWHASHGSLITVSSQDGANDLAQALSGYIPLQLCGPRGTYIGKVGEHMTPEMWRQKQYSSITPLSHPASHAPAIEWPAYEDAATSFRKYIGVFHARPLEEE